MSHSGPVIVQLSPWHYEALHLRMLGHNLKAIAKACHKSEREVRQLIQTPLARTATAEMHARNLDTLRQVQSDIQALAPKALQVLREQLDSDKPEIAQKAAFWLLESGGSTPVRRVEHRHTTSPEDEELARLSFEQLRAHALAKLRQAPPIETTAHTLPANESLN